MKHIWMWDAFRGNEGDYFCGRCGVKQTTKNKNSKCETEGM